MKKASTESINICNFGKVFKEENKVAHNLTSLASSSNSCLV